MRSGRSWRPDAMMARPTMVPNVAKAAVPTAAPQACARWVRTAAPATATVRVVYGEDDLTVQVDDDGGGRPGAAQQPVSGNGIAGMAERVAALGGEFDAGSRPEGGFRVRARFPLGGAG